MEQLLWINGWTVSEAYSCGMIEATKYKIIGEKNKCYVHYIQELVV